MVILVLMVVTHLTIEQRHSALSFPQKQNLVHSSEESIIQIQLRLWCCLENGQPYNTQTERHCTAETTTISHLSKVEHIRSVSPSWQAIWISISSLVRRRKIKMEEGRESRMDFKATRDRERSNTVKPWQLEKEEGEALESESRKQPIDWINSSKNIHEIIHRTTLETGRDKRISSALSLCCLMLTNSASINHVLVI